MILGQWSFKLLEVGIVPSSNSSSAASFSVLISCLLDAHGLFLSNKSFYPNFETPSDSNLYFSLGILFSSAMKLIF